MVYLSLLLLPLAIAMAMPLMAAVGYTAIDDQATIKRLAPHFVQSQTAKIALPNGFEALLISDPTAEISGAVLTVNVGSWEDPATAPGLAHFIEHMLFMGSKDYPEEGSFDQFLAQHGGETNAFTANDFTSFIFTVDNDAFASAVDRFASFFSDPLLRSSSLKRERVAIDEEFAKNREDDDMRFQRVLDVLSNPAHPNSQFGMGNAIALKDVTADQLKSWFQSHYSANLMRLVAISTLPIDQLKELVAKEFGSIVNRQLTAFDREIPLFLPDIKGHMIFMAPLKATYKLMMVWELPASYAAVKISKPDTMVCHLLGHEGDHSVLDLLKRKGLATALGCGLANAGGRNFTLALEVELTVKGVKKVNRVIEEIFKAIALFKREGNTPQLYNELQQLALLSYRYQGKDDTFAALMEHGALLAKEPMATYPEHSYLPDRYRPEAVIALWQSLTPQNAVFALIAPTALTKVEPTAVEPWLTVPYAVKAIPPETLARWQAAASSADSAIALPATNPFLPQNFALVGQHTDVTQSAIPAPKKIIDVAGGKIYSASDSRFGLPLVSLIWTLKSPHLSLASAPTAAFSDLYIAMLRQSLSDIGYEALLAGLTCTISQADDGIAFAIEGFSDKAPLLFKMVNEKIANPSFTERDFASQRAKLLNDYHNALLQAPWQRAQEKFNEAIQEKYAGIVAKTAALKRISLEAFKSEAQKLLHPAYVEGLFYGNMSELEAEKLGRHLLQAIGDTPYSLAEQKPQKVIVLPEGEGPFYLETAVQAEGNGILLALEHYPYSFTARAVQQLFMEAIKAPFFDALRTKQQVGYLVDSQAYELECHLFSLFVAQSSSYSSRDLLGRFEAYIESFLQELPQKLSPQHFDDIKRALIAKLATPATNVSEMARLLQRLAFTYEGDFTWIDKRIDALKNLQYDDFIAQAQQFYGRGNRRRLALLLIGSTAHKQQFQYQPLSSIHSLHKISDFTLRCSSGAPVK
jgi:insulysin